MLSQHVYSHLFWVVYSIFVKTSSIPADLQDAARELSLCEGVYNCGHIRVVVGEPEGVGVD